MKLLQFLFGKNLESKSIPVNPGSMYLDVETKELWFDDPSNTSSQHNKVIDTATLVYTITESISFGDSVNDSGATTAVLGVAKLGSMTLGTK